MSLQNFLRRIDGSIHLDYNYIPPAQRNGDQHIMDLFVQDTVFSNHKKQLINCCRLYLQAITITDISNVTGTHIKQDMLTEKKTVRSRKISMSICLTKQNQGHEYGHFGKKLYDNSIHPHALKSHWEHGKAKESASGNAGTNIGMTLSPRAMSGKDSNIASYDRTLQSEIGTIAQTRQHYISQVQGSPSHSVLLQMDNGIEDYLKGSRKQTMHLMLSIIWHLDQHLG